MERKVYYFADKLSNYEKAKADYWLNYVKNSAEYISLISKLKICRDPKDDYLVNLAIDGLAQFLITRDKDILEINYQKMDTLVMSPEKFIQIIRQLKNLH